MKLLSNIISWFFLPLFVPLMAFGMLLYLPSHQEFILADQDCLYSIPVAPQNQKMLLLLQYFLLSCLMPGLSLIIMRSFGMISTIEIDDRKERSIPILVTLMYTVLLYAVLVLRFGPFGFPKYIYSFALSGVFVGVIYYFVNLWTKVSVHAGGTGIMCGFFIAYMLNHQEYEFWILPFAFVVSGLVMSARVYLQKHTMLQVIMGWCIGCFITFAVNYWY